MSIDAVAERARAGKATIYRHFPDKAALVARAIARDATPDGDPVDTGSLRGDLLAFGRSAVSAAGLHGGIFAGLLNAARTDEVFAALLSERMWESKQRSLQPIVERAVGRGEVADMSRVAVVCEVCCAVVLHRLFVERAEPDERFRSHLVDEIAIPLLTYQVAPATPPVPRRNRSHPNPSGAGTRRTEPPARTEPGSRKPAQLSGRRRIL